MISLLRHFITVSLRRHWRYAFRHNRFRHTTVDYFTHTSPIFHWITSLPRYAIVIFTDCISHIDYYCFIFLRYDVSRLTICRFSTPLMATLPMLMPHYDTIEAAITPAYCHMMPLLPSLRYFRQWPLIVAIIVTLHYEIVCHNSIISWFSLIQIRLDIADIINIGWLLLSSQPLLHINSCFRHTAITSCFHYIRLIIAYADVLLY